LAHEYEKKGFVRTNKILLGLGPEPVARKAKPGGTAMEMSKKNLGCFGPGP
jgi:hypothetical protein